jgi:hypothetical protein
MIEGMIASAALRNQLRAHDLEVALRELLEASEIDARDIPEKAAILLDAQQRARAALAGA